MLPGEVLYKRRVSEVLLDFCLISIAYYAANRLRFGPEGFLYITTGDNHQPTLPQDLTRLGGKVLRVDRDGQPAPDNHTPA